MWEQDFCVMRSAGVGTGDGKPLHGGDVPAGGGLACRHWWGHPAWPPLVARFVTALDNPGDDHWGRDGELRNRLRPEPERVQDRDALTRTLLRRPWDLDSNSAEWIVSAGIGYLRHKVGLPVGA